MIIVKYSIDYYLLQKMLKLRIIKHMKIMINYGVNYLVEKYKYKTQLLYINQKNNKDKMIKNNIMKI